MIKEFSEDKLKEILKYTDLDFNPNYESFKSPAFYRIYSGAKGVSKSFGRMIETVYRIVNEKNFCSVWCRNQYNHIKTTLKPTLEKVLNFLADEHNLDYREYFYITNEAAYFNYEDSGKGRAIYFQNWEKIQAFQGLTLQNPNFRFGELVVDEPLEDVSDTKKLPHELMELYEKQLEKLPLLIQNTVLRETAPKGFNINVSFLYNIFTLDHFLIKDYHNKVINIINEDNSPNDEVLKELIDQSFLQKYDPNFQNGLGLIVNMYSKYFVPSEKMSLIQKTQLDLLKEQNYRLWVITVAGFAFNFTPKGFNYFMKDVILDESGEFKKDVIKNMSFKSFITELEKNNVLGVYFGFDMGIHDNASLVCSALFKNGKIAILKTIEDIKVNIKNKKYLNKEICNLVIKEVQKINELIEKNITNNTIDYEFFNGKTSLIFCDHNATIETLNLLLQENNINSQAMIAVRKPSQKFGIIDRQLWQKWLFENKLIYFLPNTHKLIKNLVKQVILTDEDKRDENINKEIYDLINAFEMSCSIIFKYQYRLLYET